MVAAFLIGIPDSFSATRELVSWVSPYGMQPIHLAFWLLGIGAIYTTIIQAIRIKRFENARPNISVESKVYDSCARLVVHNKGGDANFTAEAIVVKGVPPKTRYTMCWDSPPHLEHPIKKGGTSTIIVAEKSPVMVQLPGIVKGGLMLYQRGMSGIEKVGATTQELSDATELNTRYPTMAKPVDDSCTIEITITSTPPLHTPFDSHKYVAKIDHEQGHKLLFTSSPESNPDRGDCQTE